MATHEDTSDWKQWMQWDGDDHSDRDLSSMSKPGETGLSHELPSLCPISPLSASQDFEAALSVPQLAPNWPLTPTYSNGSPETLHLPEHRLSGDTLRSALSSNSSRQSLKRKSSEAHEQITPPKQSSSRGEKPANKKRPHNIIEKRYRANINEKIADLRKSIPSLRSSKDSKASEQADEDEEGSKPLNKAFILTKAVDYIRHLEVRNRKLDDENLALKTRLCRLEKVIQSDSGRTERHLATVTSDKVIEATPEVLTEAEQEARSARHPPEGLIPTPDSWKELRQNAPQEHYGARYDNPEEGRPSSRKWPARFMLGSLAGLMIVDGLAESQDGSDSKKKGLFGIPLEFMDGWWFLRSPHAFIAAFMQYCRAGGVIPLVKGFLALSLLAFFIFTYLFNSKPARRDTSKQTENVASSASPTQVQRQAWFTSMQTLKLPSHTFFAEWLAVNMEWLKYSVRLIFGFRAYYWLTGTSGEDELNRVKTWDIAIDAQLAGGDPDISRSRLLLSIFASGTLAKTPQRLMLKALHARVIFWRIGVQGGLVERISNAIARYIADLHWRKAQRLADKMGQDGNDLPPHLSELLHLDCEEVILDSILERACDLMYGRSSSSPLNSESLPSLMDVVTEDHAISSPLDAIGAWYSTQKLHAALLLSLSDDDQSRLSFEAALDQALTIAPPLSTAYIRALAINAVFFENGRAGNAQRVWDALPKPSLSTDEVSTPRVQDPVFIDSSIPSSACEEIRCVLGCIKTLSPEPLLSQIPLSLEHISISESSTILSVAPVLFVLTQQPPTTLLAPQMNTLLPALTTWTHRHASLLSARTTSSIIQLIWRWSPPASEPETQIQLYESIRPAFSRRDSVVSHDTGYASMTEVDEEELEADKDKRGGWLPGSGARAVDESVFSLV